MKSVSSRVKAYMRFHVVAMIGTLPKGIMHTTIDPIHETIQIIEDATRERAKMIELPDNAEFYADSAMGIYIPQYFAEKIDHSKVSGVTQEEWDILLAGPDHAEYWDVWNDVENNAVMTDNNGKKWMLLHDMDLWIVPCE